MKNFSFFLVALFMVSLIFAHQHPTPHYHQGGPNGPVVWGSYSPNNGGHNQPGGGHTPPGGGHHQPGGGHTPPGGGNNQPDAQFKIEYDRGYREGYRVGYQQGYESGLNDGEHAGRKQGMYDGQRDGRHAVINAYLTFDYGKSIEDYSDKNVYVALDYGYSQAYRQGYTAGQNDGISRGRADGYEKGKSKTYRQAYDIAYKNAAQQAQNELFYKGAYKMGPNEQLETGIDYFQRSDFSNAVIHFNVIIRDMGNTPVTMQALWWAARTQLELTNKEYAAVIYLQILNSYPNQRAKAAMEAARLLYDLKTGGFIGIGNKSYAKQALICARIIVDEFFGSPEVAEALYIQGQCYEKLKKKDKAKAVYQQVVDNYKNTPWAPLSAKRIKKLSSWW